jgi:hypothetical protein
MRIDPSGGAARTGRHSGYHLRRQPELPEHGGMHDYVSDVDQRMLVARDGLVSRGALSAHREMALVRVAGRVRGRGLLHQASVAGPDAGRNPRKLGSCLQRQSIDDEPVKTPWRPLPDLLADATAADQEVCTLA